MGGKQHIVREEEPFIVNYIKMTQPTDSQKRFCEDCHTVTYAFRCCGKRTRKFNLQSTIGQKTGVI